MEEMENPSSSLFSPSLTEPHNPFLSPYVPRQDNSAMPRAESAANIPSQDTKGSSRSRRAFKACVHCRSRKARCDLGDVDSPKEPPCARCRREGRDCSFAPSRRGGSRRTINGQGQSSKQSKSESPVLLSFDHDRLSTLDHDEPSPTSLHSSSTAAAKRTSSIDTNRARKRHRHESLGPESLAAASLRNPVDAVHLLVLASEAAHQLDESDEDMSDEDGMSNNENEAVNKITEDNQNMGADQSPTSNQTLDGLSPKSHTNGMRHHRAPSAAPIKPTPPLQTFPLVEQGVLTTEQLRFFVDIFFSRIHFLFPMVPHHRIPKTDEQLAKFAVDEPHLLTTFVVIASRYEKSSKIHERSWAYLRVCISDLMLGKPGSVGSVEALLLLSEYLPRNTDDNPSGEDHEEETRMAWMLVGMAVRLGYMLGLDQKSFIMPNNNIVAGEKVPDEVEVLHRERLAWTYCYFFDRQISIRTGKAFWSRGPGLCFPSNTSDSTQSSYDNFPLLRPIPGGVQDDFSGLVQAYVELTQAMSNAHDILYPSKDRTVALVRVGEYFKYLDAFTRSTNGFRMTWENKRWETFPLAECVWISFHYLRLYISSFAFQAHIQRAMPTPTPNKSDAGLSNVNATDGTKSFDALVFPRGAMGSPDARFIVEGIEAATELLKLCTDRLYPGGALPYLPWRFFLYFSYAGVFLLKALFIGAVVPPDQRPTVHLLKRLILCLARGSSDDQHPGVRYARLLNGLLGIFSRGADTVDTRGHVTPSAGLAKSQKTEKKAAGYANGSLRDAWPLSAAPSRNPTPPPDAGGNEQQGAPSGPAEKSSQSQEDIFPSSMASPPIAYPGGSTTNTMPVSHFPEPSLQYDPSQFHHQRVHTVHPSNMQQDVTSQGSIFNHQVPPNAENSNSLFGSYMAPAPFGVNDASLNNVPQSTGASIDLSSFDIDLNPPIRAPKAFSQLLSDHQALDGEFWKSLGLGGTDDTNTMMYGGYNPREAQPQASGSAGIGGPWQMGSFGVPGLGWST